MSLEDKIKFLMEKKSTEKEEKEDDSADIDTAEKDSNQDVGDSKEVDELKSKKKNKVTVNESIPEDDDSTAASETAKIRARLGLKDVAGDLDDSVTPDQQDDAGDNAKIKAGLTKKDPIGKLDVTEHMSALFHGEELSEEFQSKATTIFEAAVNEAAISKIDILSEEYAEYVLEKQKEIKESVDRTIDATISELVENIDGYLDQVINEWVSANQLALEGSIKVELVNSFIDGLKGLFKEHYVDIPESKVDIVEEQAVEIAALQEELSKLVDDKSSLIEKLNETKSAAIFEQISSGLTGMQKDKFSSLVENVKFVSEDDYVEKLETLKESYFPSDASGKTTAVKKSSEPADNMVSYVEAIAKNIKF